MKQIIIMTDDREKYEKHFPSGDFYITWCPLLSSELIKVRDRSNVILICMDHEKRNTLSSLGLYLRDLCIEDEKMLYLYGTKEDVETISEFVPSMCIKKTMHAFSHFYVLVEELLSREVVTENGKPVFLIIDDDTEYVEHLRLHLDKYFRVTVSRFDPKEINDLVLMSDVALISMEGTLKLSEFMKLFGMLASKKKVPGFRYYFLTDSDKERNSINAGMEKSGISISKEMEPGRLAKFIINQMGLDKKED